MNVPCPDCVEILSVPTLCEDNIDFKTIANLTREVSKAVQVDQQVEPGGGINLLRCDVRLHL